jgi:hypothetical protein
MWIETVEIFSDEAEQGRHPDRGYALVQRDFLDPNSVLARNKL